MSTAHSVDGTRAGGRADTLLNALFGGAVEDPYPRRFADPAAFDIERSDNRHLAFFHVHPLLRRRRPRPARGRRRLRATPAPLSVDQRRQPRGGTPHLELHRARLGDPAGAAVIPPAAKDSA